MMYRLATLEDVKEQLVIDTSAFDSQIDFRILAASAAIMDYLNAAWARARQSADDVEDAEVAAYEAAFGTWTDSSGIPLVDSFGDPILVYETDSNGDYVNVDSNGDPLDGVSVIPGHVRAALICSLDAWQNDRSVDLITPAVRSLLARTRTLATA